MRKFGLLILSLLLIILSIGCNNSNNQNKEDKKILITYYDGIDIVHIEEYSGEINLLNYDLEGYTFKGWYLDSDFLEEFNIDKSDEYFNNKELNLYAKMERLMEEIEIKIWGMTDNLVCVNPAFTWNNDNNSSYIIKLFKGNNKINELETNKTFYQVDSPLSPNTNYTFSVFDKLADKEISVSFKTKESFETKNNSITLVNPYSNGAVIQRDVDNLISGVGPSNQVIQVALGENHYFGLSNDEGYFEINIPKQSASFDPVKISVTNNIGISKYIEDVLFGDVYLFSGQSNMQWPTQSSDYKKSDLELLSKSNIRFYCQDVTTSTSLESSTKNGRWFKPDTVNVMAFSAIATMAGYFLANEIGQIVPIGIITAYQGDTNIVNWMSPDYYQGNISTKYLHYNAMIYPLHGTKLTGVVWYQGCNNSAAGIEYKDLLLKLFENYRDLFNTPDLPFFVIGLACYDGDSGNNFDFSYVRESQAKACQEDNNAYFISTCDDGDPTYIHPKAKRYISERVSKSIASVIYNKNYYAEGPSYKSHTVNGNKVIIDLNNSEGLKTIGKISGLYLAGEDGKYHLANAVVQDGKIVANSDKVSNPIYIKYGFSKSPFVTIFNKDGFAITPFRTDNCNTNIDLFDYDSTDSYSFHPDGSKMEIALNNGNLMITKTDDGKGYGSIRLDKWGAISYLPEGFRFTIIGTNSGASIAIRAVEGDSYEIWATKIIDDFIGPKTFEIDASDFVVAYNKQNNIFEPQKISYVEVMVEKNGAATFELCEARFISVEKSAPRNFNISSVAETSDFITISLSKSLFANSYKVIICKENEVSPIYSFEQNDTTFKVDKSIFEKGKPYYIKAIASNELGENNATNDGFIFYLKDDNKLIICNFDFENQKALSNYLTSSMIVHAGLSCSLEENGVKITSSGQGWQNFIFTLDTGSANGMKKMEFYADFSNYKGEVIIQLADTGYKTFSYTLNLNEKKEGIFTLEFSQFLNGTTPFTNQTLMWVMFNFNDTLGNGYIIFDDLSLSK